MCNCELHDSSTALAHCTCICEEHDRFFESSIVVLRKAVRELNHSVHGLQQDMGRAMTAIKEIQERLSPPETMAGPKIEGNDTNYWPPNPHSERDLLPDMWDRYGVRWTCKGRVTTERGTSDLIWQSVQRAPGGSNERTVTRTGIELEHRGPFTSKSPLAEDQEPLPDVNKYKDVEPPILPHDDESVTPRPDEEDAVADRLLHMGHDVRVSPHADRETASAWSAAFDAMSEETDGELLARLGTDAMKWAEEFVGTFLGHTIGPRSKVDKSLMTAWFANALEAGRSASRDERS